MNPSWAYAEMPTKKQAAMAIFMMDFIFSIIFCVFCGLSAAVSPSLKPATDKNRGDRPDG
jgi:hypothetical protein